MMIANPLQHRSPRAIGVSASSDRRRLGVHTRSNSSMLERTIVNMRSHGLVTRYPVIWMPQCRIWPASEAVRQ
jgi:hypothetical protein